MNIEEFKLYLKLRKNKLIKLKENKLVNIIYVSDKNNVIFYSYVSSENIIRESLNDFQKKIIFSNNF